MQVLQRTVTICKATTSGSLQQIISVVVPQRIYTFQELKLLAILSSFGEVKTFGDMNVASHFDEDAARMVVVLRRL